MLGSVCERGSPQSRSTILPETSFSFLINPALVRKNYASIRRPFLEETLFILPCNDGEAKRACQILWALKAPYVHVSTQGWGAVLDKEDGALRHPALSHVRRVLLFEIPGKATLPGEAIATEDALAASGLELVIIDHHHYRWVDRYHPQSSLEQLCELIGWPLDATDLAIAVNDRSYIPGLKKLHLSTDEILQVRFFDLEAQGYSRSYIEAQSRLAQREIERLAPAKQGDLWVVERAGVEKVFLVQELALQAPDGVVHMFEHAAHKMSFSGSPAVVDALMSLDYTSFKLHPGYVFYGGGDAQGSKYWGFRCAPSQRRVPPLFFAAVSAAITQKIALRSRD